MISRPTIIGAVVVLAIFTATAAVSGDTAAPLTRCRTEDSHNCVWIAPSTGNHHGRSFIDIDGRTYYLDGSPCQPARRLHRTGMCLGAP